MVNVSSRESAHYQAETGLLRLLELSPDDAPARRLLATVYMALGQPLKAVRAARPLVESGNRDPRLMDVLGNAVRQSQDAEAQAWFNDLSPKREPGATPESEIWQLARCRVLIHFCEQCLYFRECV